MTTLFNIARFGLILALAIALLPIALLGFACRAVIVAFVIGYQSVTDLLGA